MPRPPKWQRREAGANSKNDAAADKAGAGIGL